MPDEYREGLRRRLAATGAPLEEAVRGLFRGRDFCGRLRGLPGDVQHIRSCPTASSGASQAANDIYIYV